MKINKVLTPAGARQSDCADYANHAKKERGSRREWKGTSPCDSAERRYALAVSNCRTRLDDFSRGTGASSSSTHALALSILG